MPILLRDNYEPCPTSPLYTLTGGLVLWLGMCNQASLWDGRYLGWTGGGASRQVISCLCCLACSRLRLDSGPQPLQRSLWGLNVVTCLSLSDSRRLRRRNWYSTKCHSVVCLSTWSASLNDKFFELVLKELEWAEIPPMEWWKWESRAHIASDRNWPECKRVLTTFSLVKMNQYPINKNRRKRHQQVMLL